jgi:uncharacterized membrane protein YhaH (DUF805 family)
MYAMTENYFGVLLFLIFRLFKEYHYPFWIGIMAQSIFKIVYSMIRIFKVNTRFGQVVNGLVVGGELCRYCLYLVMLIWTRETVNDRILMDSRYGAWMIWLLVGELFFHLIGFMMTIVVDCKTGVKKFKRWKAKRAARSKNKLNAKPPKAKASKLFDAKVKGKKKGILMRKSLVSVEDQSYPSTV